MPRMPISDVQVAVFKTLGHPTRLKIVDILATEGEKCVCELVDRLGFDQSTVSKHLALLKGVGIVRSSKRGLNVTYELQMQCVHQFMKCIERIETRARTGCSAECVGLEAVGSPRAGRE